MSDDDKAEVRRRALEIITAYRDGGCKLPAPPSSEIIHEMMSFMVGEPKVPARLRPHDAGGDGPRRPTTRDDVRLGRRCIRSGRSAPGLPRGGDRGGDVGPPHRHPSRGGGHRLHDHREERRGRGEPGTRTPTRAAGVDVGNHFYCYSFEPNHDWSHFFSQRRTSCTSTSKSCSREVRSRSPADPASRRRCSPRTLRRGIGGAGSVEIRPEVTAPRKCSRRVWW